MYEHTEHTTTEPITVSGWYRHTDDTWGEYGWRDGRPVLIRLAARPPSAEERTAAEERAEAESLAWHRSRRGVQP